MKMPTAHEVPHIAWLVIYPFNKPLLSGEITIEAICNRAAINIQLNVPLFTQRFIFAVPPFTITPPRPRRLDHLCSFLQEPNPDWHSLRVDFNSGRNGWPEPMQRVCGYNRFTLRRGFCRRPGYLKIIRAIGVEQRDEPDSSSAMRIFLAELSLNPGHCDL